MDDSRANVHGVGTVVRGALLLFLVLVVTPAVVADGDALAVPQVALVLLAAIAVAIVGLAFWLATVGAPARWLNRRVGLTPDRFRVGAASVIGSAAVIGLAWFRVELDRRRAPLSQLDLRAAANAARLGGEHHLMETLDTAGIRSMVALGTLVVIAALATRAFRSAALLAATMALGGAIVEILKMTPPLPLPSFGRAVSGPTSWPSGHAALQCSLAFGVVLWWWAAGLRRPSFVAALLLPFAALVGYSRAYLGIHLLSDVLAGWMVAVVAAAVVLVVDQCLRVRFAAAAAPNPRQVITAGFVALLVAVVAVGADRQFHDRGPRRVPGAESDHPRRFNSSATPSSPARLSSAEPAAVLGSLPRYSQTLLGRRVLPLGVVVVAENDRLESALDQAGWKPAAVFTPKQLPRDVWSDLTSWTGLVGGLGPGEPLTPAFFDTRAPDIVERLAADEAEVWRIPVVTPGGCSVWGLTTARDQRSERSWRTLLPRRRIAAAIDAQRDALASGLVASGDLHDLGRFRFVAPTHGSGARGRFVTDGKIALLREPGC